jgi:hypothetical protein
MRNIDRIADALTQGFAGIRLFERVRAIWAFTGPAKLKCEPPRIDPMVFNVWSRASGFPRHPHLDPVGYRYAASGGRQAADRRRQGPRVRGARVPR